MKKILYITKYINYEKTGGGVVSRSNLALLKSIDGYDVFCLSLPVITNKFLNKVSIFFNSLIGLTGGVSPLYLYKIINGQLLHQADVIWLDSSLYGVLAKFIRYKYPNKKIITFFHNVEVDFYEQTLPQRLIYVPLKLSIKLNETLSCKYSNECIALTSKDSSFLKEYYSVTEVNVLPVLYDQSDDIRSISSFDFGHKETIFVGSNFPPNLEAIAFIIDNVAAHVDCKINIVGKGLLENFKDKEIPDNVIFLGFVDNLELLYSRSHFVLTPIFSGSGMKVKVAEALSFGKCVVGTDFSFVGYEGGADFLISANCAEDYINIINNKDIPKFSRKARRFFNDNFTIASKVKFISRLLNRA